MSRLFACIASAFLATAAAFSQTTPAAPGTAAPADLKPWQKNAFDFETGMLWKVGGDTTFNYRIIPFMLSWRTREMFGLHFRNGSELAVRNKFTAMFNYIETGSENRYLGLAYAFTPDWSFRTSAMFQHMSNGGRTNPNPGVNCLGMTLGISRSF